MPHRNSCFFLMLSCLLSTLVAPLLSTTLPPTLSSAAAPVAQAAAASTRTFTPAPLDLGVPAVALRQLQLPAVLDVDVPVEFATIWAGDPAVVEAGWEVVYQLRGADGLVAAELISELDLASAMQAGAGEPEQFWVSAALPAGRYSLSLLVRDPWLGRDPLALAMAGAQTDGSYALGTVEVGAPTAELGEAAAELAAEHSLAAAEHALAVEPAELVAEASAPAPGPNIAPAYVVYLPSLARSTANDPRLGATVGKPRGYLITPAELRAIKQKADQGKQPYAASVRELLNHSTMSSATAWVSQSSLSGDVVCSDGTQKNSSGQTLPKGPNYLIEGSRQVYGKMLTAILRGGSTGESYARNARARILDLVDTTGWGGSVYHTDNQCILYLSWYLPHFVMAADLLEDYPSIWTTSDKNSFQRWLAAQAYPKVAWASRVRSNNWGSGGSYAAALLADYLWDSGLTLHEYKPTSRSLTPGQAYREHTSEQLSRISATVAPRDQQDSKCLPYKGIQPSGAVPDELRRAEISNPLSMCTATYLPSSGGGYASAYNYQMIFLEHIVAHAEFTQRRGDRRLYNGLSDGSGSIQRGIKFIVANPVSAAFSYDWDVNRKAMLYVAQRFYRTTAIGGRLYKGEALRSGHTISYGRLTHGFASGETPASPPTVLPPQ